MQILNLTAVVVCASNQSLGVLIGTKCLCLSFHFLDLEYMKNEELPVHWSLWLHQRAPGTFVMLPVSLAIAMGTGTSFGTVSVLVMLYVPLCSEQDFGLDATTLLVAAAATVGDISFHVPNVTLAPTSGLNVDRQHDYIWDTYAIPLIALDIPMFILACLCPLFF